MSGAIAVGLVVYFVLVGAIRLVLLPVRAVCWLACLRRR